MPAYRPLRAACEDAGLPHWTAKRDPKRWFPHARLVHGRWYVPDCDVRLFGEDHEGPRQRYDREHEEAMQAAPAPFTVVRSHA